MKTWQQQCAEACTDEEYAKAVQHLGDPSPGAALSALRRKTRHTCPICGASFLALTRALYCSNRCRQAAKYARNRAEKP